MLDLHLKPALEKTKTRKEKNKMASKVRSLRRDIVHKQMDDEGHRGVNKPYVIDNQTGQKIKHNSYFSENWREHKPKKKRTYKGFRKSLREMRNK